jgi:2-polyprenyl-3-methyl-5-hydroxy-6-metoxy-1,4-benzoquinol methylase
MMEIEHIKEKSYHNARKKDVLNCLKIPGKVLDVGCGGGDLAKVLHASGFQVDGITISNIELIESLPYLRAGYLFDLENGLPQEVLGEQYDYVVCAHVLEHICYPEKLLNHIHSCLAKDEILIVALPNLFHYKSRWELVKGNFNYTPSGIWDNTHFKWYTFLTGQKLLERNGFAITYQTVTGDLPGNSFFSKIFSRKISLSIYNSLKQISHGLFGYQLLYTARAIKG